MEAVEPGREMVGEVSGLFVCLPACLFCRCVFGFSGMGAMELDGRGELHFPS